MKDNNWTIQREQTDPLALRLSIGTPHASKDDDFGYIVYRGEIDDCVTLLEKALVQLKRHMNEVKS